MGNSGSGKSTLVKTLLGFNHQGKVSGVTTINGSPARLERIKRVSAFVQQDDLLVPFADLTVSEILRCRCVRRRPFHSALDASRRKYSQVTRHPHSLGFSTESG